MIIMDSHRLCQYPLVCATSSAAKSAWQVLVGSAMQLHEEVGRLAEDLGRGTMIFLA